MDVERIVSEWPFAVVHLASKEKQLSAPAAAVFDTPDGFAFVHPGYIDPNSAGGHFFHRIEADLVGHVAGDPEFGDGECVMFKGPVWSGRIERYTYTAAQFALVGLTLELYPVAVSEHRGRTVAEERAWLRRELANSLG